MASGGLFVLYYLVARMLDRAHINTIEPEIVVYQGELSLYGSQRQIFEVAHYAENSDIQ